MPRPVVTLPLLGGLLAGLLLVPAPAHAASRVGVDADGRGAVIDAAHSTELTVSGSGFQSIKGGHGGVYVWFGSVSAGWQPSAGGRSGTDYVYIPDEESKNNRGFQQFVSFPGSDTASSAGATMSASGGWSVRLTVPGPTFQGVGRDGGVRTVDCRKVTCGVITVGAHGVPNANNETFTPVRVADLGGSTGSAPTGPDAGPTETATGTAAAAGAPAAVAAGSLPPAPRGPARLKIDRRAAVAGRVIGWTAANLQPGRQFSVVLDDGASASGPHAAGADGRASGVLAVPATARPGTHELRLFGAGKPAAVKFGLSAATETAATEPAATTTTEETGPDRAAAQAFAVGGALAFLVALFLVVRRTLRGRRAHA